MNPYFSRKLKHLTFFSVLFVVLIHAFNSWPRFLIPVTFSNDAFGPATFLQMFISNGLARFVIPALFLISGYLFFRPKKDRPGLDYGAKLSKRLRTLILPFIFWNLLVIGLLAAVTQLPGIRDMEMWWSNFSPERLWLNLEAPQQNFFTAPVNFPLWYLRDLFLFTLISPLMYLAFKTRWASIPMLIVFGVLYLTELNPGSLFVLPEANLLISFEGLFFFTLGGFLTRYSTRISEKSWKEAKPNPLAFVFLVVSLIILVSKTLLAFVVAEDLGPYYPAMLLLYKTAQAFLLVSVWMLYDWFFPPKKFQETSTKKYHLHQSAFLIFVIHAPLINVLTDSIGFSFGHVEPPGSPYLALVLYFGVSGFLMALGVGLDYTLRKLLPPVHYWLTGGR